MSKREKISLVLAIVGIVFLFGENFYFGWNIQPKSPQESIADAIVLSLLILAFFIRPVRHEEHYHTINTGNVDIIKPHAISLQKEIQN